MTMHIRQTIVTPLRSKRQALVIDAQKMQQSGVQVVYVYWVFHDIEAEVIGLAVGCPRTYSSASEPHGKAPPMMISAIVCGSQPALTVCRAAKFSAPDYQRIIQETSLFQITD